MIPKTARTDLEIIKDIMEYCVVVPKRITWIMQSRNVNLSLLQRVLPDCVKLGLLEKSLLKTPRGIGYLTTDKGKLFMRRFYLLIQLLGREVPEPFVEKTRCA